MLKKETYSIDGITFSHEALLSHCRKVMDDSESPVWYQKIFTFIHLFLEHSTGPILQRTSGTTGDPKEYLLKRGAMLASARKSLAFFGLQPGDRALLALGLDYIAGKMMVVRALEGQLDLVLAEPSARPLEKAEGRFSFTAMVPLQVHESLRAGDDLSRIGCLLIGGGALHPSLNAQLEKMETTALFESFAMTETYTHFALRRINGPESGAGFSLLDGVEVNSDKRGCLVVNIPEITEGPVVTNDLVKITDNGCGFQWLGRIDNVIKSGGIKVIPELLEKKIDRILDQVCLILPASDEKLGQKLLLLVEYPGSNPPIGRWTDLLQSQLSSHEVPKKLIPVREIPRNASLKPDRIASLKFIAV